MSQKMSKYLLIKTDIIQSIKDNELQPGDKIDSESILKKKYNVSTITVRKAFSDLINEGYLYGVQGVGTFVAKKHMIRGLTSISFSDELMQQGYEIDMIIDEISEIKNGDIAEHLQIKKDQPIICIKRVRLVNNEPIAYHISYISKNYLSLEQAYELKKTRSFYKTLALNHIHIAWVNENYSVKEINDVDVLNRMNLKKGTASFFVKRHAYDAQENKIEYAETYFNADWYSVTVNINAQ